MFHLLKGAKPNPSTAQHSESTLRDLLAELMRPSARGLSPATHGRLLEFDDERWDTDPVWAELGPLVYQRVQAHFSKLAPAARARLEREATLTAEHNAFLLDELERISARFAARRIPLMVIKGPALAHLTAGLHVRPFHDLDLLIHRHNVQDAEDALRSVGYAEIRATPRHEYHRIFIRQAPKAPAVVELHFDVGDSERAIAPDVAGIWHRSAAVSLSRCVVRAPSITDHLLLTLMQLPHHGWSLRLLADVGMLVSRWPDQIEWNGLVLRARAWGMWALTASTLYVLDAMFGVSVPEPARSEVRPRTYLHRAQWRVVMDAVRARLQPGARQRDNRLATLLLLDRLEDIASLVARRAVLTGGTHTPMGPAPRLARRVADNTWSLGILAKVLIRSVYAERSAPPQRASGGMHSGQR